MIRAINYIVVFTVVILISGFSAHPQAKSLATVFTDTTISNTITWQANCLRWNHFQGKVPDARKRGNVVAKIFMRLECPSYQVLDTFIFMVLAVNDVDKSWTTTTEDLYILAHEQIHFDIAEIHARIIRKYIQELHFNIESLKLLNKHVEQVMRLFQQMEVLYDKETHHGINEKKQLEWQKFIAEKLAALEEFSNPEIKKVLPEIIEEE
jgi:Bacterial protein of unknown function (DUF922)